jgi:tetratricopeptide (TPR) repeat protein
MNEVERAKDLFFKGLDSFDNREFGDAERFLAEALKLTPRSIPALNNLAIAQYQQNKIADAVIAAQKVFQIDPNNVDALLMISTCRNRTGQYDEALIAGQKLIAINPTNAQAHCNIGYALKHVGRYEEAIESFDRALRLNPRLADAFLNRGNALHSLKRYEEALASYEKALVLNANLAEAWVGRGNVFADSRRHDEAFECYLTAQHIAPELSQAHYNEGLLKLLLGDYERGWEKYEAREDERANIKRNYSQQLWLGNSSIANKTILLYAEQGLGDTILAARYVPMIAAMGAKVILEVQAPLESLMQNLEGVSTIIVKGTPPPDFDVFCPLMSLPMAFQTRLDTVPDTGPYLTVHEDALRKWRLRLDDDEFKVGIAWAGNPSFKNDRDRSILLKNILPVCTVPGAKYISIQKDLRPGDEGILDVHPHITRMDREITDFQDTAAIMMSLDLIISSDTSIVNLAGALARPVWVLLPFNPDWRWLLSRGDSPWYPTARLFRQPKEADWVSVTDMVRERLREEIESRRPGDVSH